MTNDTTTTKGYAFADKTIDTVAADYAAADTATKARMRADADAAMMVAIGAEDLGAAMHAKACREAMVTTKAPTGIDYKQLVADHYATLKAALEAMDLGHYSLPEGAADDAADGWHEVVGVVDAKRVSAMIAVKGRKATRGAVIDYIDAVLGDEAMTIDAIRKAHKPTDDYPVNPPSAGAIGAALDRIADGRAEADFVPTVIDGKRGAVRA